MAIYVIRVSGKGNSNLSRTYTIDAGTEDIARRKAQQRLAVDPQFRNIPFSGYSVDVDFEDFAQQKQNAANSGRKLSQIEEREKEAKAAAKSGEIVAGYMLEDFSKNEGEEAAQTVQNQSFSNFKDNFVTPGQFNPSAATGIPQGYDTEEIFETPIFTDGFISPTDKDAIDNLDPRLKIIEEQAAAAAAASGGTPGAGVYQTEASRRGQLENTNSFAAFLDELDNAGLGGLQGSAGRFMKNQFSPLKTAYEASQILPLAQGSVPFGQNLGNLAPEDAKAYQDALRRQQANQYAEGDGYDQLNPGATGGYQVGDLPSQGAVPGTSTAPFTAEQDLATIAAFQPSFGAYAQGALQAGGRQAQSRIGQQLQSLAQLDMGNMAPGSFGSKMLAPENSDQAGFLQKLAREAMGGRYSALARNAMSRFIDEDDIYSRYVQQSTPMAGADLTDAPPPPNWAQFIGKSYGLF